MMRLAFGAKWEPAVDGFPRGQQLPKRGAAEQAEAAGACPFEECATVDVQQAVVEWIHGFVQFSQSRTMVSSRLRTVLAMSIQAASSVSSRAVVAAG